MNRGNMDDGDEEGFLSKGGAIAAMVVLILATLCCCGVVFLVWRLMKTGRSGLAGNAYRRHNSYGENKTPIWYDARPSNERSHKKRKRSKRGEPSYTKSDSRPKSSSYSATPGNSKSPKTPHTPQYGADEYLSSSPTPGDAPMETFH